ncbi:MAG: soluble lytic transglycosylase B [marine bacterium B5-7]|nr:MAG: soluble lytic transglycosylase B [marine bacterium B5-7]
MILQLVAVAAGLLSFLPLTSHALELDQHPELVKIIDDLVANEGLDRKTLERWLAGAEYKESIIEAITRPAEGLPWSRYRALFVNDAAISNGVKFMNDHRETLERAHREFGVEPLIIAAIIGIETRYGTVKGNYRVIDSLSTLTVGYPRRSQFFGKELREYLVLVTRNKLDPLETKGSYAGAIGIPQFMPSSYLGYAVDFNNDGVSNLVNDFEDAIGSVANYLKIHRWRVGEPIVTELGRGQSDKLLDAIVTTGLKTDVDITKLKVRGLEVSPEQAQWKVGVIRLEDADGFDYRVGYHNFFVITTYNRSQNYAMAAFDLARAIGANM